MDPRARAIALVLIVLTLAVGGYALGASADDGGPHAPASRAGHSLGTSRSDGGGIAAGDEYNVVKLPRRARK